MISFLRQWRSRGGEIAKIYKCILGSNITFKTSLDFTHTSFEVVQASITLQHNTTFVVCTTLHQNLNDSLFTEQLPDLNYINNLPGIVCLVGDTTFQFVNPLQSLTRQTLNTLILCNLVQVLNWPTYMCSHIIDWVVV